jgi:hypothetical protein
MLRPINDLYLAVRSEVNLLDMKVVDESFLYGLRQMAQMLLISRIIWIRLR